MSNMMFKVTSDLQQYGITEKLIEEVKSRPCLYVKEEASKYDLNYKRAMWEEIASKLFAKDWWKLTWSERAMRGEQIFHRWKNMRACYLKELRYQQKSKCVIDHYTPTKRHTFLYYDHLKFLEPKIHIKYTTTNNYPYKCVNMNYDTEQVTLDNPVGTTSDSYEPQFHEPETHDHIPMLFEDDTTILQTKETKSDDDESTKFALSIVPMLNELSLDKRIQAQVSILSVLKRYQYETETDDKDSVLNSEDIFDVKSCLPADSVDIKSEVESDEDVKYVLNTY